MPYLSLNVISFTVLDFSIQHSPNCAKDGLVYLEGSPAIPVLPVRCGYYITQLPRSRSNIVTFLFYTDRRGNRRGFNRKYKDYVYRKMLVQEYLKKWRIFKRVKPKNDMMYHDIYNCICQNTKKIRFIIHYVKPTAQLLFRIRFPKGGPTCRRQVVNPRHQDILWSCQ